MSRRLGLEFLGLPEVHLDDDPIATDRRKAVALLAYLAVSDASHRRQKYSRESLSALLWPDYDQAKAFSNLRRTIWEVHQVLGEGWLIAERESVRLNEDARIDLDIARFLDLIARARQQEDVALRVPPLSDAVKLYRNHFLTGFSLKDAYPFNEWAFAESENLRYQLADALTMLSDAYCAQGQAEQAIPSARRLISLDPLNESSHRQLMEIYLQAGQHSTALKQYQTSEQILRKELNLDPQPETRALYKRIRKGEIKQIQVERRIETLSPKHNLPLQLSTFIGREKEQGNIVNLLAKNRLVTLTGTGGMGKTRLALQVGQKTWNDYPNGVWFIPLDSLSDPALVPQAVASVFDIQESADRPVIEKLIASLHPRTSLLIFDNCEHLLEACADLIQTLLTNCPKLKILATSREALGIAGEARYVLPSLSLPEQEENSVETWTDYESVQLFAERAALALSSFTLTKENIRTVVEICRKVDGIPLAIELAAARVNLLQVEEILKQLQDSFTLLARDGRIILPRHQTLQASMDWSWGLLSDGEQIFLQQLSVFAGGWTLQSAQAV
jgi:DNA-binding SARP family transcriptional activator